LRWRARSRWLARGRLARLIGETAMRLSLPGVARLAGVLHQLPYRTDPVTGLAIYEDEGGYWTAERHSLSGRYNLKATATGVAMVPARVQPGSAG